MSPMLMFLNQEIKRYQLVFSNFERALDEILLAIEGHIMMREEVAEAIDALYKKRVPTTWMYDSVG